MSSDTILIDSDTINDSNAKGILKAICIDLEERGYNPVKQIVGYLSSGDPGYISSYKECRNRIVGLDKESILELLLKSYLEL